MTTPVNHTHTSFKSYAVRSILRLIQKAKWSVPVLDGNWGSFEKSMFIESCILGVEMPAIIVIQSKQGVQVVDGMERLQALIEFFSDEYPLDAKGLLHSKSSLTGNRYSDLGVESRRGLEDHNIKVVIIELLGDLTSNIVTDLRLRYGTSFDAATDNDYNMLMTQMKDTSVPSPMPNFPATSCDIESVTGSMSTGEYWVNTKYQRGEVMTIERASAIIESCLLGLYLPPIYLYRSGWGAAGSEIVDGQQRLLALAGFMGIIYYRDGQPTISEKHKFSLTGLTLLPELNGLTYEELSEVLKDSILDQDITTVTIEDIKGDYNILDLFVRINTRATH